MQKVLLILGLVLLLAVVEQTTGQLCSLEFCRNGINNCRCRGCCYGKLRCRYGRCRGHNLNGQWVHSCFCSDCPVEFRSKSGNDTVPEDPN